MKDSDDCGNDANARRRQSTATFDLTKHHLRDFDIFFSIAAVVDCKGVTLRNLKQRPVVYSSAFCPRKKTALMNRAANGSASP